MTLMSLTVLFAILASVWRRVVGLNFAVFLGYDSARYFVDGFLVLRNCRISMKVSSSNVAIFSSILHDGILDTHFIVVRHQLWNDPVEFIDIFCMHTATASSNTHKRSDFFSITKFISMKNESEIIKKKVCIELRKAPQTEKHKVYK